MGSMDFITPAMHAGDGSSNVDEATGLDVHENSGRQDLLYDSALQLLARYRESSKFELLNTAIRKAGYAAKLTENLEHHPRRSEILRSYYDMLHERVRLTGQLIDIADAVMIFDGALEFISEDNPDRGEVLNHLNQIWFSRPVRTGFKTGEHAPNSLNRI